MPAERAAVWEQLTLAALRYGARDEAAEWAARAAPLAAALGLGVPARPGGARRRRRAARPGRRRGRPGARAGRRWPRPTRPARVRDAAHARLLAGRALAALGDADGATRELAAAEAALDAAGARRLREEAAQELRRLGHKVARRPRAGAAPGAGLEQLTEREREIAELVCDRHTNRQIAGELFLSEKTVETHLRNIFVEALRSARASRSRGRSSATRG